jgi:hypothetical protein
MVDGKTLEQGKPQGHGKRQKLGDFGDTECKKRKGAEVGIIVGHAGPSHYRELDVRNWQRRELLLRFAPTFFCGSWKVDVFRPRAAPDKEWVTLSRIHRPSDLCHVRLKWTPCHYGGSRAWLLCPIANCGRRVAILYAGEREWDDCLSALQTCLRHSARNNTISRPVPGPENPYKTGRLGKSRRSFPSPTQAKPVPCRPSNNSRPYRSQQFIASPLCAGSVIGENP